MQHSTKLLRIVAYTAIIAALLSSSQISLAGPLLLSTNTSAPPVVSYQGSVKVNGSLYSGTGYFKFAIVNAGASKSFWSNDGSSAAGSQPATAIALSVSSGVFNVLLGDTTLTGMTQQLTPSVFRQSDCYLRLWFSQASSGPFSLLTPDRRITAAPYALNADTIDGLDSAELAPLNRPASPSANDIAIIDSEGDVGKFTSITIGIDALPVIAYYDVTNGNLKVAHCNDSMCSTASITVVDDSSNDVGKYASIGIGTDGLPIISYYDATAGDLKVAHCGSIDCLSENTTTIVDGNTTNVGQYSAITIGSDGLPVISYYDSTNDDLKVAHCGNSSCTSGNNLAVPDTASGQYTAITTGADGLPIISYSVPSADGKLKTLHCGNVFCSSGNQTYLNGWTDYGVAYTSVVIGSEGYPLVTYASTSPTNRFLISIHCRDLICSSSGSPSQTAVESSSSTLYQYNSTSIGPDGVPWLSFYNSTNGNLKFGRCTTSAPCFIWIINNVDNSADDVGNYNSLTTGADGLPIISYYDATTGDLKVAHCNNPFCSPYFRRR